MRALPIPMPPMFPAALGLGSAARWVAVGVPGPRARPQWSDGDAHGPQPVRADAWDALVGSLAFAPHLDEDALRAGTSVLVIDRWEEQLLVAAPDDAHARCARQPRPDGAPMPAGGEADTAASPAERAARVEVLLGALLAWLDRAARGAAPTSDAVAELLPDDVDAWFGWDAVEWTDDLRHDVTRVWPRPVAWEVGLLSHGGRRRRSVVFYATGREEALARTAQHLGRLAPGFRPVAARPAPPSRLGQLRTDLPII